MNARRDGGGQTKYNDHVLYKYHEVHLLTIHFSLLISTCDYKYMFAPIE